MDEYARLPGQLALFRARAAEAQAAAVEDAQRLLAQLRLQRAERVAALYETGRAEAAKREAAAARQRIAAAQEARRLRTQREAAERELRQLADREAALQQEAERQAKQRADAAEREVRARERARDAEREAERERERAAAAKAEAERAAEEKAAKEKAEKEKAEKEKQAQEQAEKEKQADAKAREAREKADAAATAERAAGQPAVQAPSQPAGQPGAAETPSTAPPAAPPAVGTDWAAVDAEFAANEARIAWIKANVKQALEREPAASRRAIQDVRFELRPLFGMLTNSMAQLRACQTKVADVFRRARDSGSTLRYHYTLNLYAKLLVEQSESEANAQLQNALPLAMLTALLWNEFAELGDFVVPRIVKRCPHVIAYSCATTTRAGRKRMGYRDSEDALESLESYMGRQSGICAVWACITQSKIKNAATHPYPLSHSWTFVARHVNRGKDAATPVVYAVLAAWWDMSATRLHDAFGRQAAKLLTLLTTAFTEGRSDPPAQRLQGLGDNWRETGVIEHAWEALRR